MSRLVIVFLLVSMLFAWVHLFAVMSSLYWYYWWFDIMMHLWGGLLIGVGVHALCTLQMVPLRPTLLTVLLTLLVVTVSWEVFEWFAGLYTPQTHAIDTAKDFLFGFSGGLLGHAIMNHLYNRKV